MPCFFFFFWKLLSDRLKKKNAKILKNLMYYVTNADEQTNKQINCIIQEVYLSTLDKNFDSASLVESLRNKMVEKKTPEEFSHGIIIHSNKVNTNSGMENSLLETDAHPASHRLLRCSKCGTHGEQNVLSDFQIQLILRMEGIRDWFNLVNSCGLLSELDPPLPSISSVEKRIRIGSWNLNRFGLSKAEHPGYMEVVCLTILRANFSLVLLQEVSDPVVGEHLCAELNCPSLPHVKEWVRKHSPVITPNWKASCSLQPTGSMFRGNEYAVFLYNSSLGIRISRTSLLEKSSTPRSTLRKSFTRSPCGASCHIQSTKLVLISVHLKASGLRNSQVGQTISEIQSLGYLVQAFYETQPSGTHLIIAGDFNLFPTHEVCFL
uniref:Endo/exonuclease/phosphatase domain-containing protein n=1 Tax=Trichobilharzia regenti TaxID=157069 RepID=A0AA85K9D5_TRIRE|nr:unnamed protein product [Trichobilharzia regenti]